MSGEQKEITVELVNKRGLHARASARLAATAADFSCKISVHKDGMSVPATSIMGLMMLGAAIGDSLNIIFDGADATAAADTISELIAAKFGEED